MRIIRTQALYILIFIILTVIILTSDLKKDGFQYVLIFITVLFSLDFYRRLKWIRYAPKQISLNDKGIEIIFLDKDIEKTTQIDWEELKVSIDATFSKNQTLLLIVENKNSIIKFFESSTKDFTNDKIKDLFKQLEEQKVASR